MRNLTFFIFIILLTACSGNSNNKNASANIQIHLPDSNSVLKFEGTLPCADCNGIKTTLTLYHNKAKNQSTYKLREVYQYQNNDKTFDSYGNWTAIKGTQQDPNAIVYQLSVQNEDPEDPDVINYLVVDNNTLKLIDDEMKEFDSKANYNLTRKDD